MGVLSFQRRKNKNQGKFMVPGRRHVGHGMQLGLRGQSPTHRWLRCRGVEQKFRHQGICNEAEKLGVDHRLAQQVPAASAVACTLAHRRDLLLMLARSRAEIVANGGKAFLCCYEDSDEN